MGRDRNDLTAFVTVCASVPGASHTKVGKPNQDAYAHSPIPRGTVIAVADGLGSARCGGAGAKLAVEAAVEAVKRGSDIICAVAEARAAIESAAGNRSARDFACTLIVCITSDESVEIAHIGDGGVVGTYDDSIDLLSDPGDAEYADETDPLTARDWLDRLRYSIHPAPSGPLALFTDGCQRAALTRKGGWKAHLGFFIPLFDFVSSNLQEAALGLEDLLAGDKMNEHSDDDKTLAIAIPAGNIKQDQQWKYSTSAAGA